ncbi:hypothetical protein AAV94_06220 [Lampropedia cohaerens]|uniref:Starvation protein B n=1 Tax=Lampropedia cohaerens TaxID=1610491 RepID=A0A0U1Q0G2_9BURK|nr:ClpXP protease specificity-enhancing factor [Lampropedia cohaerens]KKW68249.1 hypothetical protein AAV94_06220 [Lampropedia cohaerens]
MSEPTLPSTQPYLLRALHEWCTDNGLTPYLAVKVDGSVQVPPEFVRNGEIVLNVSYDATAKLQLGNDFIEFQARFGGVPRQIVVPVHRVMAIYARENGQGMAFTVTDTGGEALQTQAGQGAAAPVSEAAQPAADDHASQPTPLPSPRKKSRPTAVASSSDDDKPQPPTPPGPGAAKRPALRVVK